MHLRTKSVRVQEMKAQAPAHLMIMEILLMMMTIQVLLVLKEEADNLGYLLHHFQKDSGKIIIT